MTRAIALLLAAASLACQRIPPTTSPAISTAPHASFASPFEASAWGPRGRVRFRGLMAIDSGERLRAEIAAPTVTAPLVVVVSTEGVLASLVSQRLFFKGEAGAPLLREMAGVPIEIGAIPRLLDPASSDPPSGCTASRRSWRPLPGGAEVPMVLLIRCGDSGLRLRLVEPRPLDAGGGADPFSLDPPGGYRESALKDLVDALRGSARPAH